MKEIKWKPIFYGNSKKHAISKPRASLITTFFRDRYRVPPTLDQILKYAAPTQKLKQKMSERKIEMKNQETIATTIHIHGALHARKQPEAKTNKMTGSFSRSKIQKNQIWNWNSQNHKPNTGTETGKHKGEESYKNWRDQPTNNTTKLPNMQPTNSKLELEFTKP